MTSEIDMKDVYKGDGIETCKWCGDTGYMRTFTFTKISPHETPCVCKKGQEAENNKSKNNTANK